jgi:hypothetical protein
LPDNIIRGPWPRGHHHQDGTGSQTVVGELLDLFGAAIAYLKAFGDGARHDEIGAELFRVGVQALNGVEQDQQATTRAQIRRLMVRTAEEIDSLIKNSGSLAPRDSLGWLVRNSFHRFLRKTEPLTAEAFLEGRMPD